MKNSEINPLDHRTPQYPIDILFPKRWSPRAMSGEPLAHKQLLRLFEAARWAPSAANRQEWFFLYAHRDTPEFDTFFSLLNEGNQAWCHKSAVLVLVLSENKNAEGKPMMRTHPLSAGMALMNILLKATVLGLVSHPMLGFDEMRARTELHIPERFDIHCMVTIGHPGEIEELPEFQQKREIPSQRKPVEEFIQQGGF